MPIKIIGLKVDTIANLGAYMSLFSSVGADLSLCDAAVRPVQHPGDPRQCRAVYTNTAPVDAYRGRRAARGDLSPGAHDGDGRTELGVSRRIAPQEFHHELPASDAGDHEL
jgi:carbon-monoxide dehydrogenase large subunit